jgi:hypothetical protein
MIFGYENGEIKTYFIDDSIAFEHYPPNSGVAMT